MCLPLSLICPPVFASTSLLLPSYVPCPCPTLHCFCLHISCHALPLALVPHLDSHCLHMCPVIALLILLLTYIISCDVSFLSPEICPTLFPTCSMCATDCALPLFSQLICLIYILRDNGVRVISINLNDLTCIFLNIYIS